MKSKFIIAIACNTLGATIIVIGAGLQNRVAAIATTSAGAVVSISGAAYAIARESQELIQSKQEALRWALESKGHLEDKQDLLLQFEELEARVKAAEEQYAMAMSALEIDAELIKKLEKAELN